VIRRHKKQRGQKRKLAQLLKNIENIEAYSKTGERYEHFLVPCFQGFINSKKTNIRIKREFCKKWIESTEKIIQEKPSTLAFCKVVCLICIPSLWDSQIIIFYKKEYYDSFWKREGPEQVWERIPNSSSFVDEHGIKTHLNEVGYLETIEDEDISTRSTLWFYGEIDG